MAKNFKMVDGKYFELTNEEEKQLLINQENYEKDFSDVRLRRNRLLQETDWIVIREREQAGSIHNFEAFMKYRQELRDIPTKYNKVSLVKWPTKPEIDLG